MWLPGASTRPAPAAMQWSLKDPNRRCPGLSRGHSPPAANGRPRSRSGVPAQVGGSIRAFLSLFSVCRVVLRPWALLTSGRGTSKRMHGVWENIPPWSTQQWTCSFCVSENFRKPLPCQGKALRGQHCSASSLQAIYAPATRSSTKRAGDVSCCCFVGSC